MSEKISLDSSELNLFFRSMGMSESCVLRISSLGILNFFMERKRWK